MVGQILESNLPGRRWIEERIQDKENVHTEEFLARAAGYRQSQKEAVAIPLGIGPNGLYQRRFKKGQPDGYGNDASLLCPHYVASTGQCGIWLYRPSPCISFFCESSFRMEGIEFWTHFERWYSFVELSLAREALVRLGLNESEVALSLRFFPNFRSPDQRLPMGESLIVAEQKAWCEFGSARSEFYKKCWNIISLMTRDEFDHLVGLQGRALETEMQTQFPGAAR